MSRKNFRVSGKFLLAWCLTAPGIMLWHSQLKAQQETDPWYQIEVIIFENRGYSPYGPDPEAWPRNILPAYPLNSRYLLSAEELKALEAKEAEARLAAGASDTSPSGEKPFIDLGEDFYQLKRQSNAIGRERDMRILLHKVWRQPVSSREATPAVIVKGGNQYDDHFELEGSLQISVSRYLHLDTNLWFTSFEANIGQEDTWWPNLPTPPKRDSNDASLTDIYPQDPNRLSATPPPWQSNSTDKSGMQFGLNSSWAEEAPSMDKQKNYVVKEIVTFEQSRRMRSGELHYLDHPKLGLIVRIDTYKNATDATAGDL